MSKRPKRWQETIISSPFGDLTKQDVHDYYANSAVRDKILKAVRGTGSGETILRQSFTPERVILRRKDHKGGLVNLNGKKEFDTWNQMRMTEVHPVFGQTTNTLLADIDPGKKVPWETTKSIAETIAKTMASDQSTKDVSVQFSGDRGFYIKGLLKKKIDVNEARNKVKDLMHGIAQRPDVTLGKATAEQIRIDTTPLKNRGSIKAPYSLSAVTGLVSAPVELKDLPGVKREDFKINKIKTAASRIQAAKRVMRELVTGTTSELGSTAIGRGKVYKSTEQEKRRKRRRKVRRKKTAAKKEFAPGIPTARKIDTIPSVKNKAWTLSIQQHDAKKAGKHYDVRLIDPGSEKAHSFAVPRGRLPTKRDRMLLAIQQPTHTADYALNFEGKIPAGTYGAGVVKIKMQEPINVIKANADRLDFERNNGQRFVLFRTQGNNWGFKRKKT